MKLSARSQEFLDALYWNLGSDLTQEIAIDWLLGRGELQSGRSSNGQPILIDVRPETLKDLANRGLVETELKPGPSSVASLQSSRHSVVRLLPAGLKVLEGAPNNGKIGEDNARYAKVTLDTFEFAKMLEEHFAVSELKELCAQLGLEYESVVPGKSTRPEGARAIVGHMRREGRLTDLWCAAQKERNELDWTQLLKG